MSLINQTQYMTLSTNVISGINNAARTSISLSALSTNTAVIGLYYSTTKLGFEFYPNPDDNGVIQYRYTANSTTTVLGFDGPNMFINVTNFTTNTVSIINQNTKVAGLNIFVNPATNGGTIALNNRTGSTRLQLEVDGSQQGAIQFYMDDLGTAGTGINASTVASQQIIGSTLEAMYGIVLHPDNDPTISSILSMNMDGDLYWNGLPVGSGGGGDGNTSSLSTYVTLYTSTLYTTNMYLRGENSLDSAVLYADSELNLYWNNQKIAVGQNNIFESTIYERAVIINISTLRITTSTIQGVYDEPSLPPKLLLLGDDMVPTPIYYSLDNSTYNLPDISGNGYFNNTGNSIYGNMYTGQLIAVGTDDTNSFGTIQWSIDAANWNYITENNPFQTSANSVYYANGIWLIGGTVPDGESPIIWSSDGYNFNSSNVPNATGTSVNSFAFNNGMFVAAINTTTSDAATSLLWSNDGQTWFAAISGGYNGGATAVGSNNNPKNTMWVAAGITILPVAVSRIKYSQDGKNWITAATVPNTFVTGYTVNYANGLWHVGGTATTDSGSILWSSDGINWNSQITGNLTGVNKINYINDVWYVVGQTILNNGMLSSSDGYNWTPVLTSPLYTNALTDIYYLENVLLGNGSINYAVSTSIYVPATVSSNLLCSNSIISATATISSLTATSIVSPNYLQVQTVAF